MGLRVLLISDSALPRHDGIATSLRSLTAILDSLDFGITLIGAATGVQYYPYAQVISAPAVMTCYSYPVAWPIPVAMLKAIEASDIVHIHTLGPLGVAGLIAAKASRRPTVFSMHANLDVYAEYYPVIRVASRILAIPKIDGQYKRPLYSITKAVTAFADAVVLPNSELANSLPGLSRRTRLYVIPNEVLAGALVRTKSDERADILYVGRMVAEKSVDTLLRCFANYALKRDGNRHLTLVGDGPKLPHLVSYASSLGLSASNVRWLGDIDNDSVLRLMSTSQVLALPSLSEVEPMVLTEAGAVGLPAVVRDSRLIRNRPELDVILATTCESFGLALLAASRTNQCFPMRYNAKFKTAEQWRNVYRSFSLPAVT
ncbi:MAG: glycosyltransferase [Acetobacteraceae bacterium]|jgi:1,2-diacylglycerol 3-alpha-glucosyltransferase